MGGAGLGAVSSYSVKFQMSELISNDFSQRQFVRSSVNLTSSNKIEERDCCFAYWFIFLLSHIFSGSAILIKAQARLQPLRDYGSPSFTHTHTLLLFDSLILIYLPFILLSLHVFGEWKDADFVFSVEESFALSSPASPGGQAQQGTMALGVQTEFCKVG